MYYLFTDEDGTVRENGNSLGYLYYCDKSINCKAINDVGYYVNSQSDIYSCSNADSAKCKKYSAKNDCLATTIGELFIVDDELSLCLNYVGSKAYSETLTADVKHSIVNYKEGNIFGITNNKYALVKIEEKSVTLDKKCK